MAYTNEHDLPGILARALSANEHKQEGKYSVSQLLNPPQLEALKERHKSKVKVDVSGNMWALFGTAVHEVIRRYGSAADLIEQHLVATVDGIKISGTPDHFNIEKLVLNDWKVTSVYTYIKGGRAEWEQALNVYAYLLGATFGKYPKYLFNRLILRDFNEGDRRKKQGYPDIPFQTIRQDLWPKEQAEAFIVERIRLHEDASKVSDEKLPPCTKDEKWQKDDVWALKDGPDSKRAINGGLFYGDSGRKAAEAMAQKHDYFLEHRPGERIRCERFCEVKRFCKQYEGEKNG